MFVFLECLLWHIFTYLLELFRHIFSYSCVHSVDTGLDSFTFSEKFWGKIRKRRTHSSQHHAIYWTKIHWLQKSSFCLKQTLVIFHHAQQRLVDIETILEENNICTLEKCICIVKAQQLMLICKTICLLS